MNNLDTFEINHNNGDIIGVGIHGNNNIIAKNVHIDQLILETRSFGLELLHPDYFEQHQKVEENVKNWYRGFSFSLESIYYGKEFKRNEVVNSIISKINDQRCLLLLGESGSSKTTLLGEVICHYYNQNYTVFYSYGDNEISNPEKIRDAVEDVVSKGNKVLIALDNVHDKKMCATFYLIELLNSFNKSDNVAFILTARIPDYDWFVKCGLNIVQNRSYKDALKSFDGNPNFKYTINHFTVEEINGFMTKYGTNTFSSPEQKLNQSKIIHGYTNGTPVLVKFAILGSGLRKDVEDRIEDYLKGDSNFMLTAIVTAILSIGGIKITDQLLEKMCIKKYAARLKNAILYNSKGLWDTINSRWDTELLRILFIDEKDDIVLDVNKEILGNAIMCMLKIDNEDTIVAVIQTLYNTIAINNFIPLEMVDSFVSGSIPNSIGRDSMSVIYGVIMPPAFIMAEKYDKIEKLCECASATNPSNAEICYNLALTLAAIGKYDKSIQWCDKAIEISSDYGEVWYMRSCLNMIIGKIEIGMENLEKAMNLGGKETYSELAKRETYFDSVRDNPRFIGIVTNAKQ
jgi:tetratricopeptide (TPR) repeat protein